MAGKYRERGALGLERGGGKQQGPQDYLGPFYCKEIYGLRKCQSLLADCSFSAIRGSLGQEPTGRISDWGRSS